MGAAWRLAIVALLLCGCTASRPVFSTTTVAKLTPRARDPLPVTPRALEQLPAGRYYQFQTVDPKVSYIGRIVRADGESVELTDVDCVHRTIRKTPLLGDIPIPSVRAMFRDSGVGVEILEKNKTLPRTEIASMQLLTPAEVEHRLTVKQRVPTADPPAELEQVATQQDQGWHAAG